MNKLKESLDTISLITLGLFSFGGATGRFVLGLGLFDFLLLMMFSISVYRITQTLKIRTDDIKILGILFLILLIGILRAKFSIENVRHDFFITELRFFLYLPILYIITLKFKLCISVFEKVLPFILLIYIFIWTVLLNPGTFIFDFFNNDFTYSMGTLERIKGPPILFLIPLLLILINQKPLKPLIIVLYTFLILAVFIKTGGRTYFIFYLFPIFYIMYKKRKNMKLFLLSVILILASYYVLKEFTSSVFFERFLNIVRVTEDSSFLYRVYNIEEMLSRLSSDTLWLGFGIGSNYEVNLFGWKSSFFLDNTFITLIYKIGLIGLIPFLSIFIIKKKYIPRDLYYFEIISLILIGSISYHIILNPVFVYGYFLIFNYFRSNHLLNKKNHVPRNN